MKLLDIARVCHEANAALCLSQGDTSQPSWEDAPDWQKESAVAGVRFHLENPGAPASSSHESWLAHKEADGWKYGKEKNPDKKEHPCMVPFDELPVEQQSKDFIFRQLVHSLVPHMKGKVIPEPARKKRTPAEKGEMLSRKETNQKIGAALRKKEAETERKAPKPKVKPKKKKAPTKKKPAKAAE